ncbi:MAG: hypothetical protein ACUVTB_05130 [Candidatus Bathycorpusculaceae bacterium]
MKHEKLIEEGVRRVVWIPRKLDQEIETIRHKIGYTRSGFYRYALTRFLEDILLHKQDEMRLQPWQEIIGTPKEVKTDKETTTAIITCTQHLNFVLTYPNETKEAQTLQTLQKLKGQKVAILKTDIPEKPIIIRTLNDAPVAHKIFCKQLLVRSSLLFVALKMVAFNVTLWHFGLR